MADVAASANASAEPIYVPRARAYLVPYPKDALTRAVDSYEPDIFDGMRLGVLALSQRCTHLDCKVPWCASSQWFECPCHGAQFNRVGEKKGGPAYSGLESFPVTLRKGQIVINTGRRRRGTPLGTNTTGQEAEGPHCVHE